MTVATFRSSRKAKVERDRLLEESGLPSQSLDRLAIALSISRVRIAKEPEDPPVWSSMETEDGNLHQIDELDFFDGQPIFSPALEHLEGESLQGELFSERLRYHLNRGYDVLYRAFEKSGSWDKTLATISPPPRSTKDGDAHRKRALPIEIEIGRRIDTSEPIIWRFNQEAGSQTNSNIRLAGMPGVGKSQVLLHILSSICEQSETGFFLFDYKGDLHTNEDFLKLTGATVFHPGETPIPINPFQLPPGLSQNMAPRTFAELCSLIEPKLGAVQKQLITKAVSWAYQEAPPDRGYPTLSEVFQQIQTVYAEAERKPDSVTALLGDLTSYDLFSDQSEQSHQELLRCRWVINLAGLPMLREFVASVFLESLHQTTRSLNDAPFDHHHQTRNARSIIAIDEAHYYLRRHCQPLLDLIRTGRSKGFPVFLSSQSLEDFRKYTELNEFLPNTFVFKHGNPPDRKTLSGSLGVSFSEAEQVASAIPGLEKFSGYSTIARDPEQGSLYPAHLTGLWERI